MVPISMQTVPSLVMLNTFLQTWNTSATTVGVGVHVLIGVFVGVPESTMVAVLVGVSVGVFVAVLVGVLINVLIINGVFVTVGVFVAVLVVVFVGVAVAVLVEVGVKVLVVQPEIKVVTELEVTGAGPELEDITAALVMGFPQAPAKPHQLTAEEAPQVVPTLQLRTPAVLVPPLPMPW